MRELAKSMMRFSWSLSLLGCEQMSNLLRPPAGLERAAAALDAVARSTEEQLGPRSRATFQGGDSLQGGMVDLVFDLLDPRAWSRAGGAGGAGVVGTGADVVRRSVTAGLDLARRSAEVLAKASSAPASGASSGPQGSPTTGWGPMPGAGR